MIQMSLPKNSFTTSNFDPNINKGPPYNIENISDKFCIQMCNTNFSVIQKQFFIIAQWPWPSDPKSHRGHPRLVGTIQWKFRHDKWNIHVLNWFRSHFQSSVLWPWSLTFWLKSKRGHSRLMYSKYIRFHCTSYLNYSKTKCWWLLACLTSN